MQKKILLILAALFALVIFPVSMFYYYNFAVSRPSQIGRTIDFEIKKGKTVSEISDELFKEGAINSTFLFNLYVLANGFDKNLQAGIYAINPGVSIKDLAEMFQHGIRDTRITFLEGWRVEEFAREAYGKFKNIDYIDFVKNTKNSEGYLFPDTYYFRDDVEEEDMIAALKSNFDEKVGGLLTDENLKPSGLTEEEVVIFSSIVEREVSDPDDRQIVAGILIKRWKEGMKLEVDATTQYAVSTYNLCGGVSVALCAATNETIITYNWWPKTLTQADLDLDSPFNTRKNVGLPPGPISSFGISSVESVLNYKNTDYYFYLTDNNGITHFAKTLDEHNLNVQKYLTN